MKMSLRAIGAASFALATALGCGPGVCVSENATDCTAFTSTALSIRSTVSTIRKNDCYPLTVGVDSDAATSLGSISVALDVSSDAVLYSSKAACQTADSSGEVETLSLSAGTPEVEIYVRADSTSTVEISATSSSTTITKATQSLPVSFSHFHSYDGLRDTVTASTYDSSTEKSYLGSQSGELVRIGVDGAVDTSFATQGTGFNSAIYALEVQADGKLLVGGIFSHYNGAANGNLTRLNLDGTRDATFSLAGSGLNAYVTDIAVQADGKILIVGNFDQYNGAARRHLARLNSDGSLDTSFSIGTGVDGVPTRVVVQSNGKVLIGGPINDVNGTTLFGVARLLSDGTVDTAFDSLNLLAYLPGVSLTGGQVSAMGVRADGKVTVVLYYANSGNGQNDYYFLTLNTDGTVDSLSANYGIADAQLTTVACFDDGGFVLAQVVERVDYSGLLLNRIHWDGTDLYTVSHPKGSYETAVASTPHKNGAVLIAGQSVRRFTSTGSVDSTFAYPETGFNSQVAAFAVYPDGRVLAGGSFSRYDGTTIGGIARLQSDGSLDSSWGTPAIGSIVKVSAIAIEADERVIVAGNKLVGGFDLAAVRLNTDGTIASGFELSYLDGEVSSIALQNDGKIFFGGFFTLRNGVPFAYLRRVNSDSTTDNTFTPSGTGFDGGVNGIVLQPDGKIIAVGAFTEYDSNPSPRIARILSDGSFDSSFVVSGSGFNGAVTSVKLAPDGKVLVAGSFSAYNGTPRSRVARLNSDGSLDTSFAQVGSGLNNAVSALALQSDGKLVVGGSFTQYGTTAISNPARLNSDGSLDTSFNGIAVNTVTVSIASLLVTAESKILVGGIFLKLGADIVRNLARLTYSGALD